MAGKGSTTSADVVSSGGTAAAYRLQRARERAGTATEDPPPKDEKGTDKTPTAEEIRAARQAEEGADAGKNAKPVHVGRRAQDETREPDRAAPSEEDAQDVRERAAEDRDADGREIPPDEMERRLNEETSGADREPPRSRGNRSATRRVEQAVSKANRTYEDNIRLRAENEELKREQKRQQQQAQEQQQQERVDPNKEPDKVPTNEQLGLGAEPKQGDYDDPAEFVRASVAYEVDRRDALEKHSQRQAAARAEQDASERAGRVRDVARQAHSERMAERKKNDPKFASLVDQRVKENGGTVAIKDMTPIMLDSLAEMEHGDVVHAHLIEHPEKATEIAGLSLTQQVGRIHVLAKELEETGGGGPEPSTTPPPTDPVRTTVQDSGGGYPDDLRAYKERRQREREARSPHLRAVR